MAFGQRQTCAHLFQWLANALHGPPRERIIAHQREASLLGRKQARDHAHRRAGVAAIERGGGSPHVSADAGYFN